MHILIDTVVGAILGFVNSAGYAVEANQIVIAAPPGCTADTADEWAYVGGELIQDPEIALSRAQAARIAAIKSEASAHLGALDWKLERAREREQAGWAQLVDVSAVLAERESVRRSSNAAEAAVLAMTDLSEVAAFTWAPDAVAVSVPRLLTHEQFIQRFTEFEWQSMTEAARANAAMDAWMRRFALAGVINLDDSATQAGVQALEIAGILAAGRAAEILGNQSV